MVQAYYSIIIYFHCHVKVMALPFSQNAFLAHKGILVFLNTTSAHCETSWALGFSGSYSWLRAQLEFNFYMAWSTSSAWITCNQTGLPFCRCSELIGKLKYKHNTGQFEKVKHFAQLQGETCLLGISQPISCHILRELATSYKSQWHITPPPPPGKTLK